MARRISLRPRPKASRPHMPGYEMMFTKARSHLPWTWAVECMSNAHNYWVATTRPDGRPHIMPVWGIWLGDGFYFSTGRGSRKSRNLTSNANCVVCPENAREAIILEGTAREITDATLIQRFADVYKNKYDYDMSESQDPVYRVTPAVVFGLIEGPGKIKGNPTRWTFNSR